MIGLTGYVTGRFAYAAPATPPGISGIAVIRMAGSSAFEIADEIFVSESHPGVKVSEMKPYTCAYGSLIDPADSVIVDKVVLTKFSAPHSYTGEDTVEISCHGGSIAREKILEILFKSKARPAGPGEFTRNAFLNGKLDLAQAEAVMDLISSQAGKAGAEAVKQLQGKLSAIIHEISRQIYRILAEMEMILEFPEQEESAASRDQLLQEVSSVIRQTEKLIDSFGQEIGRASCRERV